MQKDIGFGQIQVYYGDGKGKTTAALGQALRAFGAGKKVALIYFDKGGSHYNERSVLDTLKIPYYVFGRDRIDAEGKFDFSVIDEDIKMAVDAMELLNNIQGDFDLIVLDEVLNAIKLKMMDVGVLEKYLTPRPGSEQAQKPQNLEVILTGRGLPAEIEAIADLITEMKLVKHYFYKGVGSREGIEW